MLTIAAGHRATTCAARARAIVAWRGQRGGRRPLGVGVSAGDLPGDRPAARRAGAGVAADRHRADAGRWCGVAGAMGIVPDPGLHPRTMMPVCLIGGGGLRADRPRNLALRHRHGMGAGYRRLWLQAARLYRRRVARGGHDAQGSVAGKVTSINGAAFVPGRSVGMGLYQAHHSLPYPRAGAVLVIPLLLRARRTMRTVTRFPREHAIARVKRSRSAEARRRPVSTAPSSPHSRVPARA